MLLIYLYVACQTDTVTQERDSVVLNEQQRYADFVRGLQAKSEQLLPEAVYTQEALFAEVKSALIEPMESAFLSQDASAFFMLLDQNATLFLPVEPKAVQGLFPVSSTQNSAHAQVSPAVIQAWQSYLDQFEHIDDLSIRALGVDVVDDSTLSLALEFDLRGEHATGRLNHKARIQATATKLKEDWRITALQSDAHKLTQSRQALFADVTEASGLDKLPKYPRLEALRRGGYAISLSDIDNDNDADMFVGGWGESRLFVNDGSGQFQDITQVSNIAEFTKVKAAAIADMDNDGDQDIVLSRFIDLASEDIIVLNNNRGIFELDEDAVNMALEYDRAMPLTVADFNQDGLNDIYVGFPGVQDFTFMNDAPPSKNTQGIFYADGQGGYQDQTISSGLDVTPQERELLNRVAVYPHAVVTADLNGDGSVDIMVADDRRGDSKVYQNISGLFSETAALSGLQNKAWAMGIAVGDYDNDGLNDIYFSNIDFLAAKRIQDNYPELTDIFQGNRLYRNLGDGQFEDMTETAGVGWAGEAAAGASWFDYDSDGDLDLYVTNGLWTGPKSQDLSSTFVQAYIAESFKGSPSSKTDLDALSLQDPGFYHLLLETLTNFSGDLDNEDSYLNTGLPSLSLGGDQRNVLFQNNGDGTFTDVAYVVGLDSNDDGYMASVADLNLDGRPDLVLRNCDPGTTAYTFPSLRVFQNQLPETASQLAIKLQGNGVDTNRDAIGAQIKIYLEGQEAPMIRELATVNGAAQSENIAFFGLGDATQAQRVEVRWPNGSVTNHGPLTIGRHLIEQPK